MVEIEPTGKKIVQQVIRHINELDGRVKDIKTAISEVNDLQIINKLDIINLKNEIDRMRLGLVPAPTSPQKPEKAEEEEKPKKKEVPKPAPVATGCPQCGAPIPLKAKYCSKCGKKVKR